MTFYIKNSPIHPPHDINVMKPKHDKYSNFN